MFYAAHEKNKKASRSKFRRFLSKCDVIVVKTHLSNSKPCNRCVEMLKKHGVRRVYYSYERGLKMEKVNQLENEHLSSKFRRPWSEFT